MHDLIIVGAGTAGCVLAERLTSSGKLRVLLVEAGGPPASRFVSIPAGFAKLFKCEHRNTDRVSSDKYLQDGL
jgi:choline dehydrogenase